MCSPSGVSRLWRSYRETGEYTMRQDQDRSTTITPIQDRFMILLSLRNHMSTARTLDIDFRRATYVHFPTRLLGINSIVMVRETDDRPKGQFSLRIAV